MDPRWSPYRIGSMNSPYAGETSFQMEYQGHRAVDIRWLSIDPETLWWSAGRAGLELGQAILAQGSGRFLSRLTMI